MAGKKDDINDLVDNVRIEIRTKYGLEMTKRGRRELRLALPTEEKSIKDVAPERIAELAFGFVRDDSSGTSYTSVGVAVIKKTIAEAYSVGLLKESSPENPADGVEPS